MVDVKRPGIIIISAKHTQKDWIMKHSEGFLNIVNDAKSRVREVSVAETQQRMRDDQEVKLIDVR
jgi:hypothetical protein